MLVDLTLVSKLEVGQAGSDGKVLPGLPVVNLD
jgi:hypothetical protein